MADLKYYDGTQWVTLKGSGVALSTVGVDMTDCDLTPDAANGAFTADGTEADGTQKYKLDLNLPRGTVVTESDTEPATADACVGDLWIDPTGDDNTLIPAIPDSESVAAAWCAFNPNNQTLLDHYNVTSVDYDSVGQYGVNFETPLADANYATLATADVYSNQTNVVIAISRQLLQTASRTVIITTRGDAGANAFVNPAYAKAVVFCNE